MKKSILCILCLLVVAAGTFGQPKYEVRAVWLTTIGGIDWPSSYAHDGMGIGEQKRQLTDMLDRLKKAGVNTVMLQTRVRATTIYPSGLEPWDGCLSGKPGRSPGYDALQYAIDECHRRGMELHAWVVTIPIGKWNSYGCQQLRRNYPSLVMKIGEEGYMNPERAGTADYLTNMCEEIVSRYDIDGIHLDYIRYPETWRGAKSAKYITDIVRAINRKVKAYKPWVKISCSPIGKYDDLARYSSKGWNARRQVAQDAQGWLREGLMDQLYPMMYFQGNNFYPFAIDWQEQSYGRTIVSGLGIYMLHPLVPPMTWAQSIAPTAPTTLDVVHTAQGDRLKWNGATDRSDGPYLLYNVYASTEKPVDTSNPQNLLATRHLWKTLDVPRRQHARPLYYAVTAIDRYGNESSAIQEMRKTTNGPLRQPLTPLTQNPWRK